jgi:uncharacterized HAD superfamily protein
MDGLSKIKEGLPKRGLALDIDETISATNIWWFEKMQKIFGNPESLTAQEMAAKYRYTQDVPYWQMKEVENWIEYHRHSNSVQKILPLIENSNEIVQKIDKIIPVTLYITSRPKEALSGTKEWLRNHNFPLVGIITEPKEVALSDQTKWKAKVLENFYPKIQGIIDDNPGLAKNLSRKYKGTLFLYDMAQSDISNIKVVPCPTWDDVLIKVREIFG